MTCLGEWMLLPIRHSCSESPSPAQPRTPLRPAPAHYPPTYSISRLPISPRAPPSPSPPTTHPTATAASASAEEAGCYGDYDSVFLASYRGRDVCSFAGTAVAEIASYGIPLRAIVVGKLLLRGDGGSNWAPADAMRAWVERAQTDLSWSGGVMVWVWERHASQQWLHTIYPQLAAPAPPTLNPHNSS